MQKLRLSAACVAIPFAASFLAGSTASAQGTISMLGRETHQGTVKSVRAGTVVIQIADGDEVTMKIQDRSEEGVSLAGARAFIRFPATVKVSGEFGADELKPGVSLRFTGKLSRLGKTSGEVQSIQLFDAKAFPAGIEVKTQPAKPGDFGECEVTGRLDAVKDGRMTVTVPKNDYVKREKLIFKLAEDAKVSLESNDYRRAKNGDIVEKVVAAKFSTGDTVISELTIRVSSVAKVAGGMSSEEMAKYQKFSDEPGKPRDLRSQNILLHTDISDRSAKILLDKLETMLSLMSQYYGRRPNRIIECYVVRDLKQWPPGSLDPSGVAKIAEPAGVTISLTLGKTTQAVVYSCDQHGVVQHECVHAYCAQTFGDTGPTWYSEGMAEMGQYWKEGQRSVEIDPVVIDYLKNASPKSMLDIVAAGQITGDSWQAYSWRWVLCYLLETNPNYRGRFKGLGLALMAKQPGVSFESVYGPLAKEISFEYDQFVEHMDNGYQADLTAWQWNRKFLPAKRDGHTIVKPIAKYGWQASLIRLEKGVSYDFAAKGTWNIDPDVAIDADGSKDGTGRLVGVIFKDFKLSEPIELGKRGSFVAPGDGDLYLRCRDKWNSLADNDGQLTLYLRRTQAEAP